MKNHVIGAVAATRKKECEELGKGTACVFYLVLVQRRCSNLANVMSFAKFLQLDPEHLAVPPLSACASEGPDLSCKPATGLAFTE